MCKSGADAEPTLFILRAGDDLEYGIRGPVATAGTFKMMSHTTTPINECPLLTAQAVPPL